MLAEVARQTQLLGLPLEQQPGTWTKPSKDMSSVPSLPLSVIHVMSCILAADGRSQNMTSKHAQHCCMQLRRRSVSARFSALLQHTPCKDPVAEIGRPLLRRSPYQTSSCTQGCTRTTTDLQSETFCVELHKFNSLKEPGVGAHAAGAIHARGHPRVVVVDHAVLLSPPIEGCHEEHEAKHPPHDSDLHSVELLQICRGDALSLRALLLEPVPQHQLHDLTVFRSMDSTSPEDPVLGHWLA